MAEIVAMRIGGEISAPRLSRAAGRGTWAGDFAGLACRCKGIAHLRAAARTLRHNASSMPVVGQDPIGGIVGRCIAGVVVGIVAWVVVATVGNLALRLSWPAYAAAEAPMQFDLAMMIARLIVGALSSLAAGMAVARITKGNARAAVILGLVLTAIFVPVHYRLWDKFPIWYHLAFLVSLLPLTMLGAILARTSSETRVA
jgi:hypothetical protein